MSLKVKIMLVRPEPRDVGEKRRFEDREVFAVGPHLLLDTSKIPDFIQMYDEGRGAKVVGPEWTTREIRKDR